MYHKTPGIKETKEATSSASFLGIYLKLDSPGQLSTRLSDKRHDLKFVIITFPQLDSNISKASVQRVYISQLEFYSQACSLYSDSVGYF